MNNDRFKFRVWDKVYHLLLGVDLVDGKAVSVDQSRYIIEQCNGFRLVRIRQLTLLLNFG